MAARIQLPNGCSCSQLTVTPRNWKTLKASMKFDWYISYRFYDPTRPKPKQRIIKGMNEYKTLKERQDAMATILYDELHMLQNRAYNPFTGECLEPEPKQPVDDSEITTDTPFIEAMEKVMTEIKVSITVRRDLKSVLKYFSIAAKKLEKDKIPVGQIRSRDVRLILNACQQVKEADKKKWSENQFNHYRAHISMLFALLSDDEIIDFNPVLKIKKADYAPAIRTIATKDQRKQIDKHLQAVHPVFRRYVNIFFHSGARSAELLRIQGKHVDLIRQTYKALIKKRKKMSWVDKVIKDIAVPFWTEALVNCGPNDYVFGRGLVPGPISQDPHYVSELWLKHIKNQKENGGIGIDVDMYSLKHTHTTEVMDILEDEQYSNTEDAVNEIAGHNSHTSGAMVVKIYDTKGESRKGKKVKGLKNSFA